MKIILTFVICIFLIIYVSVMLKHIERYFTLPISKLIISENKNIFKESIYSYFMQLREFNYTPIFRLNLQER